VLWSLMEGRPLLRPTWQTAVRSGLRAMLNTLARCRASPPWRSSRSMPSVPAHRDERDTLLRRFNQFYTDAPRPVSGVDHEELVSSVVGGIYATIRRHVAAGNAAGPAQPGAVLDVLLAGPVPRARGGGRRGGPR
jgi:hypothetical protein